MTGHARWTDRRDLARLGLPLANLAGAWASAAILLGIYVVTMAPSLTFYDSPELALVAAELGVGHPIGMPLHTLIGWVFAHLPGLTVHQGLTLMSALFGAACVLPAWSLSEALLPPRGRMDGWLRALTSISTGAGLVAWEPATRVEVYTLAAFLSLWAVARMARGGPDFLGGLALGLGASSHAVIATATGVALVPLALSAQDASAGGGARARALGRWVAGGCLGLATYAYLPLVAADPARFAWGAPTDLAALLSYLKGADYAHNQGIDLTTWLDHLGALGSWGWRRGPLLVALFGAAAYVGFARQRRGLRWALPIAATLDIGFVAANVTFHPDVPDYCGYYLVPLWLGTAGLIALSGWLTHAAMSRGRFYAGVCAALPLLALAPSAQHLTRVRDSPSLAETIARGAFEEASPGAILIVESDHWVAPLLYLQEVEGLRPDVRLIPIGLASSSWYFRHLFAIHPDLPPIPLAGTGGRIGRIRRLIDADHGPVLVESVGLAQSLGLRACGVALLVHTECAFGPSPDRATQRIRAAAPFSAEALEVAARVGEARGEALWRLGWGKAAVDAWLAGLPESGIGPPPPSGLPLRAPPLGGPLPAWQRPAALHDPARNLAITGLLLGALGHAAEGVQLADTAIAMGLAEASQARAQILQRAR